MAAHAVITLDTTPPSLGASIAGGAPSTATTLVSLAVDSADAQGGAIEVRIWGHIDPTDPLNANYAETEDAAPWINLESPFQVRLLPGSGQRRLWVSARDVVHNSQTTSAAITLIGEEAPTPPPAPPGAPYLRRGPLGDRVVRTSTRLRIRSRSSHTRRGEGRTALTLLSTPGRLQQVALTSRASIYSTATGRTRREVVSFLRIGADPYEIASIPDDGPDDLAALIALDLL